MNDAHPTFKDRIRLRVNGLLQREGKILLVQLLSPITDELIWTPPGGGLQFGEQVEHCLKREFREETGLKIKVGPLCFFNEMIERPFHAVELYFNVETTGGILQLGRDPELGDENQLLKDLQWIDINQLDTFNIVPKQLMEMDYL